MFEPTLLDHRCGQIHGTKQILPKEGPKQGGVRQLQSALIDKSNNRAAGGYGDRVPLKVSWSPMSGGQLWTKIFAIVPPSRNFDGDDVIPIDVLFSVRVCHLECWLSHPATLRYRSYRSRECDVI